MAVITISREMGTGAYHIAEEVARKLKYTLVDGERISACAPKYGLSPDMLQMVDEKPPSYITAEDRKRAAALNTVELILLDFARKGNVVLYGRGGQDLMKGCKNVLRLRFIADFEERVERFAEREWIDPDLARDLGIPDRYEILLALALGLATLGGLTGTICSWAAVALFVAGMAVMMLGVGRAIQDLLITLDALQFEQEIDEPPATEGN